MAAIAGRFDLIEAVYGGAIAQLVERVVRNDEVGGSNPPGSTSLRLLRKLRLGKPYRAKAASSKPAGRRRAEIETPLLPRKPRRPLLHKARHPLAKVAAAQRHRHFAVGVDGGFGQRLERHVVKLPLDYRDGARRDEVR